MDFSDLPESTAKEKGVLLADCYFSFLFSCCLFLEWGIRTSSARREQVFAFEGTLVGLVHVASVVDLSLCNDADIHIRTRT